MGCCGRKTCDRPKEEMLGSDALLALAGDGSWVLNKLLDIAKGGSRFVGFKSDSLNELAAMISALVAENEKLKTLFGIFPPGKAKADDAGVTISFGPRGEYTLFIPAIADEARERLSASLIAAGKQLKKKPSPATSPAQQYLPFDQ